ncbi:hypothetical protein O181_041830 [Austropuccinia psidii MF-1]|uniref:Uncharacterized protein n=1 Tax=Austropuccinia psidii MF-1 TaxID=1389203 RepID=A0A9Q3DJG2_9BASI|nr:hypothetical protein [Austropuccinia psidii MF-1]
MSPVPSSINLSTPLLGHHLMITSLLDQREVIIPLMKDGDGKRTKKTHQIPPDKTLLFLVCLRSKPRGNPPQAQVAPNGQRNHCVNPPEPKSHLLQPLVHPLNHLRTCRLVSQNLRWLQRNPRRNLLVNHHFSFFTTINFSSPFLRPSPACPATPRLLIIINNMPIASSPPPPPSSSRNTPPSPPVLPIPSPEIPPSAPKNPGAKPLSFPP